MKKFSAFMFAAVFAATCIALTACESRSVSNNETSSRSTESAVSSTDSSAESDVTFEQETEESSSVSSRVIYLNGSLRYIESLTPVDYLLETSDMFVSVYGAKEPKYSSLLTDDNFVGTSLHADEPKNELEADLAGNARVYCDGVHAAYVLPYSDAENYAAHFDEDVLDKISYQERLKSESPNEYDNLKNSKSFIPYSAEELDTNCVYLVYAIDYTDSDISFFTDYDESQNPGMEVTPVTLDEEDYTFNPNIVRFVRDADGNILEPENDGEAPLKYVYNMASYERLGTGELLNTNENAVLYRTEDGNILSVFPCEGLENYADYEEITAKYSEDMIFEAAVFEKVK